MTEPLVIRVLASESVTGPAARTDRLAIDRIVLRQASRHCGPDAGHPPKEITS